MVTQNEPTCFIIIDIIYFIFVDFFFHLFLLHLDLFLLLSFFHQMIMYMFSFSLACSYSSFTYAYSYTLYSYCYIVFAASRPIKTNSSSFHLKFHPFTQIFRKFQTNSICIVKTYRTRPSLPKIFLQLLHYFCYLIKLFFSRRETCYEFII